MKAKDKHEFVREWKRHIGQLYRLVPQVPQAYEIQEFSAVNKIVRDAEEMIDRVAAQIYPEV